MPAEGRRPTFIVSLKEGRRGDCREVKMIGKPYAGKLQVRFDEGGQDFFLRTTLNGHEAGNGGYSQELA